MAMLTDSFGVYTLLVIICLGAVLADDCLTFCEPDCVPVRRVMWKLSGTVVNADSIKTF